MDFSKFEGLFNAFVAFLTKLFGDLNLNLSFFDKYQEDLKGIAGAAKDLIKDED